jgi:hypothetical protein
MNTTNCDFIAAHRRRQSVLHPAGQHAASHEVLLTCPVCGTPNFSERGLRAHHCRAKPGRERLTPDEINNARTRATRTFSVTPA